MRSTTALPSPPAPLHQPLPPSHTASLRAAPNRFQAILAEADEGVIVLEPTGAVSFANAAAEFLLGRERIDLVGEMFGLPLAPTSDRVRINVQSTDGAIRLVELAVETLPQEPSGTLVLRLHDVTDHHRDVADAKNQVRRRDEFLAMLSHEIRNPLAAIHYASTLLTAEACPTDVRRDAASVLKRQFEHLGRILDDLLDISRINQGKLVLTKTRVDVSRVVQDVADAIRPLITGRSHTFHATTPSGPHWLLGDATRLEQIVVNLLNNAAKFTPAGGDVSLSAACVNDEFEIRIRDNGPGI
ncbi:MAG TPA: histidine kinase dimerization/phospho-acceptor domain-containing protein, partial [Pirellulales bacterium]